MSFSRTEIISEALVRLGEAPISSEADHRASIIGVSALYDRAKSSLLSEHPWYFAIQTADLDQYVLQVGDPDLSDMYQFAFKLPADLVTVLALMSGADYTLTAADLLWTDESEPKLLYVRDAPESEFPVWFAEALMSRLATVLCLPVTGDNSRFGLLRTVYNQDIARAMAVNDAQAPPTIANIMRTYRERLSDRFL